MVRRQWERNADSYSMRITLALALDNGRIGGIFVQLSIPFYLNEIKNIGLKRNGSAMSTGDKEDRNGFWENELKTLGIEPKRRNDLNDKEELEALADNIKQVYYQNFKLAYNERGTDESRFDYII